jgi:hypothetical protein
MIYDNSIQLIAWFSRLKDWIFLVIYFLYNGCFNINWIFVCDLWIQLMI